MRLQSTTRPMFIASSACKGAIFLCKYVMLPLISDSSTPKPLLELDQDVHSRA